MAKLTNKQLEKLREFDSPTICNAMECFNIRPRTAGFGYPGMVQRAGDQEKPMIGYAVTAKVSAMNPATPEQAKLQMELYAKNRAQEGPSIICIQDTDAVPLGSYWGEVQATTHKSLGAVGTLVQGGVRDIPAADELGFYFMSTVTLVSHAYIHVEAIDCPVVICGLTIKPGDLIHADIHGFTIIPEEVAPKLYDACVAIAEAEMPVLEPCRKAITDGVRPTIEDLAKWRAGMAEARKSVKVD
ncbi:MAG: RraA family protein [Oscillospiraceae bacterium]